MTEPNEMARHEMLEYIDAIEKENYDLVAKVVELISIKGWDDDGSYTFKDGDRWYKFDPLEAQDD